MQLYFDINYVTMFRPDISGELHRMSVQMLASTKNNVWQRNGHAILNVFFNLIYILIKYEISLAKLRKMKWEYYSGRNLEWKPLLRCMELVNI